ncbi:MAG: glycine cleavage system aminomethyltransferase GcvT [bacterium]
MESQAKKTPLYDAHVKAGAKIVAFAGYLMPVQYRGILDEHRKVRRSLGLFDVSHMGEFTIRGANALEFLQKVTINDVSKLAIHQAQYTAMCYQNGGIVDDLIVYRFEDHYTMIVNASNLDKDFAWLQENLVNGVDLRNESEDYALMALQGRYAEAALQKITDVDLSEIRFYWFKNGNINGIPAMIARTGYTGEDGFEIAVSSDDAAATWDAIMVAGEAFEIEPIGLGARDTLRLEMKYCLYGNDIDETTNPLEAGLGWITKMDKGIFIGSDMLKKVKEEKPSKKLIGLQLTDRNIARQGYEIFHNGEMVGAVTSGSLSPSLNYPIALAYVNAEFAAPETMLTIKIRNREVPAKVVKTPFYKRPY